MAVAGPMTGVPAPAVGDVVMLRIRAVASGGAGIGTLPDGRAAFVHRTAPEDEVRARITKLKSRWSQAELVAVLSPGPARVEAPCPHYGTCGGCTLQHLAYEEQLRWKARFVTDALARIGGIGAVEVDVEPSPMPTAYRNRVTFTVRTLPAGRVIAGFHGLHDPDRIVDLTRGCLLPEPAISEAWAALRAAWRSGARPLPPARELRVTLRSLSEGGVVVLVKGGAEGWDPEPLRSRVPGVAAVWHQAGGRNRPVRVFGAPVHDMWGQDQVPVSGQSFLQVNRQAAAALVAHVVSAAGAPARAVDAYCGVGAYGRALARLGWDVMGIESDSDACEGARHEAPDGFRVVEGLVEEQLPGLLPVDLVILNPPRTGLQEWVPDTLIQHKPGRIVYVSCDPATLARDAGRLSGAYTLSAARCFDLFPQTSHVETVAVFTRNAS
jgi:23S rRNA (uracil1939-C5)-methyltransferase